MFTFQLHIYIYNCAKYQKFGPCFKNDLLSQISTVLEIKSHNKRCEHRMSYLQYEPPSRCLAPGSFRTPLPCARRRRPSPVGSLIRIWWWQCQRCTTDFLLWSLDWNHKQISLDRGTQQERYQASVLSDLSKSCCTNSSMRFYSWIAVALEYLSFLYLTYLKFG